MVKVIFSFQLQGIETIFSQGTVDCQNLKQASVIMVDTRYTEISSWFILNEN